MLVVRMGGSCAAPAGNGPAGNAHGGGLFDSMGMGGDLFSNSEFEFNRESRGGILFGVEPQLAVALQREETVLSLNGDVRTTMVGADYEVMSRATLGKHVALDRPGGAVRQPAGRFRQVVERSDEQAENAMPDRQRVHSGVNELPSVVLTTKFLDLCKQYGAERLAVGIVAAGRSAGVPGLPDNDDWTAWNADEMRAAVEHLQRKRGTRVTRR